MKQLIKRITSLLCAGLMGASIALPSVYAEEESAETPSITLPSGKTIEELQTELESNRHSTAPTHDASIGAALVGVFQGDEVLYTDYFGYTNQSELIPADENSCFEWGSITKTFIWVSAFQLWEQGKLDFDKDVREYLPAGFFQHLSYDEPITMMNLMNHNAGWQETTSAIMKKEGSHIGSLREVLQEIEPTQINKPGEVIAYSNYGAAVAGYVIECITGQDFCDYVHEHIFEPLEMEHTALRPDRSDNPWVQAQRRSMHAYSFGLVTVDLGYDTGMVPAYPAGAATGTIADMIRYGQALVDDSAPLFEHPETQAEMLTGTTFYGTSDIPACCHGFWCSEYSVRVYGHSGGTRFGQANLEFDPVTKVGYAVMVNEPNGNWYLSSLPNLVFGYLDAEKYGTADAPAADLPGYYLPARSIYRGMLKFEPYLIAIRGKQLGEFQNIGNNLLQQSHPLTVDEGGGTEAAVLGRRTLSDGRQILESPSCDLILDPFYLPKLCLLTAYVLSAAVVIYLVLIRIKLKNAGKWQESLTDGISLAGQIARAVSLFLVLVTYTVYAKFLGGIPQGFRQAIGIGQMLCIAFCACAALAGIYSLFSKKGKPIQSIAQAVTNSVCVTAILCFDMYQWWRC